MRLFKTEVVVCPLLCLVCTTAVFSQSTDSVADANWPQWRGPLLNGVAPDSDPPLEWNESKNLKWKTPIEGRGHSTPIVWGDRIFLVTAIPTNKEVPEPYIVPADTPNVRDHSAVIKTWKAQSLILLCLDRDTGEELWRQTVREVMPHQGYHWKGSFASASPITDGEHVFVYFGSFGLYCYDFDGGLAWKKDLGFQAMEDSLGEGSSPALWNNTLVVVVDHELQSFIVAMEKGSGEEIWRQNRDEVSNWSTPRIFEHNDRMQVVVNGETVYCYDFADGEVLWKCGGQSLSAIPIPAIGHGMVFATSGFAKDNLHAIKLGQTGDLTDSEHIVWRLNRGTPYVPCPMLWGDELYLLEDRSFFSCLNAQDGEQHFLKNRLPGVLNFSASPVGAADRIYLLSEEGRTVVVKRGKSLEVLAVNEIDERFYASPAIVGNAIYLRGENNLYCFEKSESE